MDGNRHSNNIINLTKRIGAKERMAAASKTSDPCRDTRVIAITSGKGGVGKTNIVANLGYALTRQGKKVLVLDADWGLGNLDVLLGLTPRHNLSHVVMGEKRIADIIVNGPGQMKILPASSGIQELTQLTFDQKIRVLTQLDVAVDSVDVLLIDTAAGISSNVMDFNVTAQEIAVVVTPEPTSLTDAYALMKVLSVKYAEKQCKLIVNMAASTQEGQEIYRQLNLVAGRFLDIEIDYLGCVFHDEKLTQCVKRQKILGQTYPSARASRSFASLAQKISASRTAKPPQGDSNFFWNHLVQNKFA